ncbi:MAG: toxin TcdB middle/N-terminal domain-containing protein [Candidatus Bathyarchaeia archaeon]
MTDQSGVSPEILPLPKGGGAIRSIGEYFSPDLHTGTGNYRIPLWFPLGPNRFQPDMGIVYSSGAGNGPFGIGWHIPVMKITRRTDRGLPTYDDALDTFLLDNEEIVPVGNGHYQCRREEKFRRIERNGGGWIIRDKGGRSFLLGTTPAARVEDTQNGITRIYAWLIEKAIDTNGNEINYSYHRHKNQIYLKTIAYSVYSITFIDEIRPDPFTERRAGFDITTALRYSAIEYRINGDPDPCFRRYTMTYNECPYTNLSLLASVTFSGSRNQSEGPKTASMPTLRFTYTPFSPSHQYHTFISEIHEPPPLSLEETDFDLVDLFNNGLPGVIQLSSPIHRFWPNKGHGCWGPPRSLSKLPAVITLDDPAVGFADMDGNGTPDLVILSESPLRYYINEPGKGWTHPSRFHRAPTFNPDDPELLFLDLNGDGLVDAMRTGQQSFYLYYNRGDAGWDSPVAVARTHNLAAFPDVFFSDSRVKLADMTGDGLIDIVWVHSGVLDYWPHYGNGHFGRRIKLFLQPTIGFGFNPNNLFLGDINGDGVSDVIYLESDGVHLWINQGGNSLVSAGVIHYTPPSSGRNVQLADMFGSGTMGLVWSYPYSRRELRNYKYMDFTEGVHPYLLSAIDDGTGLTTEIEYKPSTEHLLKAEADGKPWKSTLPFPVQIVSRIIQRDLVAGTVTKRHIHYYDGWFDGRDREFRGFGRAEVLEEGNDEVPSTLTISYFHQGRQQDVQGSTHEIRRALSGKLYRLEVFSPDEIDQSSSPFRIEEDFYEAKEIAVGLNGKSVVFPYLVESRVSNFERTSTPIVNITKLIYDNYGNVIQKNESWDSGRETKQLISSIKYTVDTTRWVLNLPIELKRTDGNDHLLGFHRFYYDGDPFVGLPLGGVEKGNLTRREDMVLTDDIINNIYGASPPDYATLGYHRMTVMNGQSGWGMNGLRQAYDSQGNVTEQMDGFGNIGKTIYDVNSIYPSKIIDPKNFTYDITYDLRSGEISHFSEPNGHETSYFYDPIGRLITMIKPGDSEAFNTTEFEYLDSSLPLGVRTRLRSQALDPKTLEMFDIG